MKNIPNYLEAHFTSKILNQDQVDNNMRYQDLMMKTATNSNKSRFLYLKFIFMKI